jgi:hypothetical protein
MPQHESAVRGLRRYVRQVTSDSSTTGVGRLALEAEAATDALMSEAHTAAAYQLPALASRHVGAFGGTDAVIYLADVQQAMLVPFLGPDGPGMNASVDLLSIDATLAGRAFQQVETLVQSKVTDASTVWLPLLDGSERLGVVAVSVDGDADALLSGRTGARLRRFVSILGELVMTKTLYGDTIVRLRRLAQMGLAAEMQWSLLPPLTFACPEVTIAAALEPAYEVAGDTFDYAIDYGVARFAVLDGMGHGFRSAQSAVVAVAAYRHARRAGQSLLETCAAIDDAVSEAFGGSMFTTAVLAELDTSAGLLRWVNAGHPEPFLLRDGRLVKTLHAAPRPPLGLDVGSAASRVPVLGTEQLEPGDGVLLYTDGVTEARSPNGEFFGEQRLVDLIVRHMAAGLPAPETMRRLIRALLEHQQGHLTDDASLVLITWAGGVDPHDTSADLSK